MRLEDAGIAPGLVRRCGELRSHRVVAAEPLLLHSRPAELVAGVDRRRAGDREEHGERVRHQLGADRRRDAGDVVVADEGLRCERRQQLVVPLDRVAQLEEVPVGDAVPDALPQLVLRERVHRRLLDDPRGFAVDHLAEEPRLGKALAHARQHLGPERPGHRVRGIQSPPVDAAIQPVAHHVDDEIDNRGGGMVEGDERVMPLEDVGLEASVDPTPAEEVRSLRSQTREGGVPTPHMVEDPVEQDPDAALPRCGDEAVEVPVVAEPRVDAEVIDRVVAVRLGGEHRTEQQAVQAQLDDVVEPALEAVQAVYRRGIRVHAVADRRPHESQRVDVPPDDVFRPRGHGSSSARRLGSRVSPTLSASPRTSPRVAPATRAGGPSGRALTPAPGRPPVGRRRRGRARASARLPPPRRPPRSRRCRRRASRRRSAERAGAASRGWRRSRPR